MAHSGILPIGYWNYGELNKSMKHIGIAIVILLLVLASVCKAQFAGGSAILGAHIGISNVARATVLGIKFEAEITEASPGFIGGSGTVDYYSWNAGNFGNQTYLFFIALVNYHLKIEDGSLDPYIGIGAGYLSERNTFSSPGSLTFYNTEGSGITLVLSLGARYFLSPNFAIRLEFGSSLVYAMGGLDFSL
jgi:hypothetical protein